MVTANKGDWASRADNGTGRISHMKFKALARLGAFALSVTALGLAGCGADVDTDYPSNRNKSREIYNKPGQQAARESVLGEGGFDLFGGRRNNNGGSGIAVNSFLWRASLDTLSFMPLSAADPFGGVIITDWYSPPETPDRRFKANAYILDRDLRADGIRVTLFQQRRDASGTWMDSAVDEKTATDLEDAILTRARQLRVDQASR